MNVGEILKCGCTADASGFGWCSECVRKLRSKIWAKMSENRKNYDRQFAPKQSEELDSGPYIPEGCSCHINPPCSFCVQNGEPEQEIQNGKAAKKNN